MLNNFRFQFVFAGLTAIAQKVYEAVPISEAWTVSQITAELARSGSARDHRVVGGCLKNLVEAGLVKEPQRGSYVRQPVKKENSPSKIKVIKVKEIPMPVTTHATPTLTPAPADQLSPIDELTKLSARCIEFHTLATSFLKGLAIDIDNAALKIEEQMSKDSGETQKLRQLKTLLKELG